MYICSFKIDTVLCDKLHNTDEKQFLFGNEAIIFLDSKYVNNASRYRGK